MNGHDRVLEALQEETLECTLCELARTRSEVVFGEGSMDDGCIMFVGEAPGADEDATGLPFVGESGRFLDELLLFHGSSERLREMQEAYNQEKKLDYDQLREALREDERIFYTNVVCCRPPHNRDPNRAEMAACRPRLEKTIYLVDPIVIVTLGKVALNWLTGKNFKITSDHGRLFEVTIQGRHVPLRYPVFPLVHPAMILREGDHDREGSWAQTTDRELTDLFEYVDATRNTIYGDPIPNRK